MRSLVNIFMLCGIAMCGGIGNAANRVDAAFKRALTEGATLELRLVVRDERGEAVPGARIRATLADRVADHSLYGVTDKNGIWQISDKTTGDYIELEVSADGFYTSKKRFSYIEMGKEHKVIDGKWQPYGDVETIQMRKVVNPQISCTGGRFQFAKNLGSWVGFDLEKGEFVRPYGNGEVSDFEVIVDWDGKWLSDYSGMGVRLRFTEPYSGFYEVLTHGESVFKGPYSADAQGRFSQEASFFEKVVSDTRRIHQHFPKDKCWVVRSRCRIDEHGKLKSANYSVVHNVSYCGKQDGRGGLLVEGAFNSTPNDTNLEPRR